MLTDYSYEKDQRSYDILAYVYFLQIKIKLTW